MRLNLLHGDLSKAQHLIQVYDLEKTGDGMYFHFWEMTQLVLLRAKVLSLPTDPLPASVILEALSTLIAESERRERVTPVIEACILRAYAHHAVAQHEARLKVYPMPSRSAHKADTSASLQTKAGNSCI